MFAKNILFIALSGLFLFSVPMLNSEALASGNSDVERASDFFAQINYLSGSEVLQIQMTSLTRDQPLHIFLLYKGRVMERRMETISKEPRVYQWDLSGYPPGEYEVHFKSNNSGDQQRFKKR